MIASNDINSTPNNTLNKLPADVGQYLLGFLDLPNALRFERINKTTFHFFKHNHNYAWKQIYETHFGTLHSQENIKQQIKAAFLYQEAQNARRPDRSHYFYKTFREFLQTLPASSWKNHYLGCLHLYGKGVSFDIEKAIAYFEKSYTAKEPLTTLELAKLLCKDEILETICEKIRNPLTLTSIKEIILEAFPNLLENLKALHKKNHKEAAYYIAQFYTQGISVKIDHEKAKEWLAYSKDIVPFKKKGLEDSDAFYQQLPTSQREEYYRKQFALGDESAAIYLSKHFYYSDAGKTDLHKSYFWMQLASQYGHATSADWLFFSLSGTKTDAFGYLALSVIYQFGMMTEDKSFIRHPNNTTARKHFEKALELDPNIIKTYLDVALEEINDKVFISVAKEFFEEISSVPHNTFSPRVHR